MNELKTGTGQQLYEHARTLIPGGTQLLSKRPELFLPDFWPAYYSRAKGCEVWDLDGRRYLDFATNGIGATVLGFADPDVDAAVIKAIGLGQMSTLNCPEDVQLAEKLIELHPWAEMARFARGGGEAMVVAMRIARAASGKDIVLFCGYHGWHDWYLAANIAEDKALDGHLLKGLEPAGVVRNLGGTSIPFHYNDVDALNALATQYKGRIGAIVMEPSRSEGPAPGFLERVRAIATSESAPLVFDEVTSGFRVNCGGIHMVYGIEPDIAVFAKSLGNGYPMAAIIGRRAVMDAAQNTFISSTTWTERLGPTAALAMIGKHQSKNVSKHLIAVGQRAKEIWTAAAESCGLRIHISGLDPLAHFDFESDDPIGMATLFIQELLSRGFLSAMSFYASYAHQEEHLDAYRDAVGEAFRVIADAQAKGDVRARLWGPVKHSGFQRLA